MRILGVDPGTQKMGYSILDLDDDTDTPRCLDYGTFDGGRSKEIAERLHLLLGELQALAERWAPDQLAIEEPFVAAARGGEVRHRRGAGAGRRAARRRARGHPHPSL